MINIDDVRLLKKSRKEFKEMTRAQIREKLSLVSFEERNSMIEEAKAKSPRDVVPPPPPPPGDPFGLQKKSKTPKSPKDVVPPPPPPPGDPFGKVKPNIDELIQQEIDKELENSPYEQHQFFVNRRGELDNLLKEAKHQFDLARKAIQDNPNPTKVDQIRYDKAKSLWKESKNELSLLDSHIQEIEDEHGGPPKKEDVQNLLTKEKKIEVIERKLDEASTPEERDKWEEALEELAPHKNVIRSGNDFLEDLGIDIEEDFDFEPSDRYKQLLQEGRDLYKDLIQLEKDYKEGKIERRGFILESREITKQIEEKKKEKLKEEVGEEMMQKSQKILDTLMEETKEMHADIDNYVTSELDLQATPEEQEFYETSTSSAFKLLGFNPKMAKVSLKNGIDVKNLPVTEKARSAYYEERQSIKMRFRDSLSEENKKSTLFHEISHAFQNAYKTNKAETEWVKSRAISKEVVTINSQLKNTQRYESGEKEYVIPDKFIHPYVGRVYVGGPGGEDAFKEAGNIYEVISMAFENFSSPERLANFIKKDPEHFKLAMGLIRKARKQNAS